MADTATARSIAFKTDLAEHTSGIGWEPALRGFKEGDYYLIMRTFDDNSPDVRKGRKFSHVLAIEMANLKYLENIEQLVSLLPQTLNKQAALAPINIDISEKSNELSLSPQFNQRFHKLVYGYLHSHNFSNIIVWHGQEYFELAVTELWKRLTVGERNLFAFGIGFNSDIQFTETVQLMAVPDGAYSKFVKTGYFIIEKDASHKPSSFAEEFLIGDKNAITKISKFQTTLGLGTISRQDIQIIAKGIDTFEDLNKVADIKKLNTLSHIISQYAPSQNQGSDYKLRLIDKISELIKTSQYKDILVLRNFRRDSFKSSQKILEREISKWIEHNILIKEVGSENCISFFNAWLDKDLNWWDNIVQKKVKNFLSQIDETRASVVYSWLFNDQSILAKISASIDKSKDSESNFSETLPRNIPIGLFKELRQFATSRKWFRLLATLLKGQMSTEDAIAQLLKVDAEEEHLEGIHIILEGKTSSEILRLALSHGDIRLLKMAGKECNKQPKLLKSVNIQENKWQTIWVEAIQNGNTPFQGFERPEETLALLLDELISGTEILPSLLEMIGKSEYGNILNYKNRSVVWEHLAPTIRLHFLKQTSTSVLNKLSQNSTANIPDDKPLVDYIRKHAIDDFVYLNRNKIKNVIPIFENFALSDGYVRDYITNYIGEISAVEATQLGKLVSQRRYIDSAYSINRKSSKANNWKFALAQCHHLLDFFTQGQILFSGTLSSVTINANQWWDSLEDIVIEFYPNYTSLTTVWKKAGGKESDLLMNATPEQVWQEVFYRMRRRQSRVSVENLLQIILKQYGDNGKFRILYDLKQKFI